MPRRRDSNWRWTCSGSRATDAAAVAAAERASQRVGVLALVQLRVDAAAQRRVAEVRNYRWRTEVVCELDVLSDAWSTARPKEPEISPLRIIRARPYGMYETLLPELTLSAPVPRETPVGVHRCDGPSRSMTYK